MKKKFIIISSISVLILFVLVSFKQDKILQNSYPDKGYVPDEITAMKVAEAILLPIYGKEILEQKPYKIQLLKDSIWVVTGVQKEVQIGGVFYIEIQKSDCKILKVSHGK